MNNHYGVIGKLLLSAVATAVLLTKLAPIDSLANAATTATFASYSDEFEAKSTDGVVSLRALADSRNSLSCTPTGCYLCCFFSDVGIPAADGCADAPRFTVAASAGAADPQPPGTASSGCVRPVLELETRAEENSVARQETRSGPSNRMRVGKVPKQPFNAGTR